MRYLYSAFIQLSVFAVVGQGCTSLTSFQTARTTKEGRWTGYLGLGSQSIKFTKKSKDRVESNLESKLETLSVPIIEGGVRRGITKDIDVGGRLALLPGVIGIDGKYQLSGESKGFASAVGLGLDYTSFSFKSGSSSTEFTMTDISAPLFLSYGFWQTSAVYVNPRLVFRMASSTSKDEIETHSSSASTLAGGVAIGVALDWFVLEYSILTALSSKNSADLGQLTAGIRFAPDNLN